MADPVRLAALGCVVHVRSIVTLGAHPTEKLNSVNVTFGGKHWSPSSTANAEGGGGTCTGRDLNPHEPGLWCERTEPNAIKIQGLAS